MSFNTPQVQQGSRRYPHNGQIFGEVSEKLNANGYSRTPEQCHTRIKRLKSSYRQCKENMRWQRWVTCCFQLVSLVCVLNSCDSGSHSSSGSDRVDFKFYDLLEQILEKQPSTSSTVVTDSIEISEDSNQESVAENGKPSYLLIRTKQYLLFVLLFNGATLGSQICHVCFFVIFLHRIIYFLYGLV